MIRLGIKDKFDGKTYIRMYLGIGTYTFPWAIGIAGYLPNEPMTANDLLYIAIKNKIKSIQFGDNYPLHLIGEDELDTLTNEAKSAGINIEVGTRGLTEKNLIQYLRLAQKVGSPFLRVVIDDQHFHPSPQAVIEIIRPLVVEFKKAEVILAIENHDRFPAKCLENIIEATDQEWVGICLDSANSFGAGEGIGEVAAILLPYTVNLHIKDFKIHRVAHKMGFEIEGCPAGEGLLNIPELIAKARFTGKCISATLEIWSNPATDPEKSIIQEREWVSKSLKYLKTIVEN